MKDDFENIKITRKEKGKRKKKKLRMSLEKDVLLRFRCSI